MINVDTKGPYVLKFSSEYCAPCKIISKMLESSPIPVYEVDVNQHYDMVEAHAIDSVPTVVILDGDNPIHRFVGTVSKDKLLGAIDALLL